MSHELPRTLLSIILTSLIYHVVCLILTINAKTKNDLNDALKTQDDEIINKAM
jgi:1,4-dihydroxy-2-naphthoate octaprenyltransferase